MVPRRPRAVAVAVVLLVCGTVGTACGPGAAPGTPRAEPLTQEELMSVLPSGKELPGNREAYTTHYGAVPARILREQHGRLRDFLAGSGG
ncbi:hypothetical protein ACIPW5_01100 [Streptomyces sp. NPDC090077]|uniref:hypothetical protein n=1 Tax=Streptomyces sp. NPDC090077 TaxID=3365938 RepID=UPI0038034618